MCPVCDMFFHYFVGDVMVLQNLRLRLYHDFSLVP